jgi:hypothetical protein
MLCIYIIITIFIRSFCEYLGYKTIGTCAAVTLLEGEICEHYVTTETPRNLCWHSGTPGRCENSKYGEFIPSCSGYVVCEHDFVYENDRIKDCVLVDGVCTDKFALVDDCTKISASSNDCSSFRDMDFFLTH